MPLPNFAPLSNEQVINPWSAQIVYGPVTYQTMNAGDAALEKTIVERVASYGRQLSRITDALTVLANAALPHVKQDEAEALRKFLALAKQIEAAKARYRATDPTALERLEESLEYLKENDDAAYQKLRLRLQRLLQF
jgi:hypothetical protein